MKKVILGVVIFLSAISTTSIAQEVFSPPIGSTSKAIGLMGRTYVKDYIFPDIRANLGAYTSPLLRAGAIVEIVDPEDDSLCQLYLYKGVISGVRQWVRIIPSDEIDMLAASTLQEVFNKENARSYTDKNDTIDLGGNLYVKGHKTYKWILDSTTLKMSTAGMTRANVNDSSGILLQNPKTSTAISDTEVAHPITWDVNGWTTASGGHSKNVKFRIGLITQPGVSIPNAFYTWSTALDGASTYTDLMKMDMTGKIVTDLNLNGFLIGAPNTFGSLNLRWGPSWSTMSGGDHNTAIGASSMTNLNGGTYNSSYGYGSLTTNHNGDFNTAIGALSLNLLDSFDYNTAIGYVSMNHATKATQNTAVGANSLFNITIGIKNNGMGAGVLEHLTTGSFNDFQGVDAGLALTTGNNNVGVGWTSVGRITTSSWNTGVGYKAGVTLQLGDNNTFIGSQSGYLARGGPEYQNDTVYNSSAFGAYSYTTQDYEIAMGDDSTQHFTYRGDGVSIRADSAGKFRIQSKTNLFDTTAWFGTKDHYGIALVRTNDADYLRAYIKNMTSGNLSTIDGLGTNVVAGKFQFTQNSLIYAYQQPLPIIRTLPYAADDPTHVYNVWIQNDTSSNNVFPWRDSSYYNPLRVDYMTHGGDTQNLFLVRADSRIFGRIQSGVGTKSVRYNPTTREFTYADTTTGGGGSTAWSSITGTPTTLSGYGITDGANTALSNLASVAINTSLLPGTDNAIDLGSASKQWRDLYLTGSSIYMAGTKTLSSAGLDLPTGGGIRTRTSAGNTVLLQAYDVDGTSYTTFGTLTANNTPTFDLSSSVTIGSNTIATISTSQAFTNKDLTSGTNTFPTFNQNTTGSAATLTTTRTIWGQNFNGSANVTGNLTSVGNITGGANNMDITAGTGNSRIMNFYTTTSGGAATLAMTLNADQSVSLNGTSMTGATGLTVTGGTSADQVLLLKGNSASSSNTGTNSSIGFLVGNSGLTTAAQFLNNGNLDMQSHTIKSATLDNTNTLGTVAMTLGSDANYDVYYRNSSGVLTRLAAGTDGNVLTTHSTTSAPTWTAAGSGDMVLASSQSVTGLKTFDKDKIAMKGTSTGVTTLSTANTGASNFTITMPAATGTIYTDASGGITSSSLATALSDETGTSTVVFSTSPTITSLNLGANSTTLSAIQFTPSGASVETASEQGDMEVDANGHLYYSTAAAERGVVGSIQYVALTSANTLTSQTGVQPIFDGGGGPTNGRITVAASRTYFFECDVDMSNLSATSGTFSFALGGTATLTSIRYNSQARKGTVTTLGTPEEATFTSASSTVLVSANGAAGGWFHLTGTIRVNGAGTLIPQIAFSTVAGPVTPVIGTDSWFRMICIGTNTVVNIGNWD